MLSLVRLVGPWLRLPDPNIGNPGRNSCAVRSGFIRAAAANCREIERSVTGEQRFDTWTRRSAHTWPESTARPVLVDRDRIE